MEPSEMLDYETSVSFLGIWGPYQRKLLVLLCFMGIPSGCTVLSVIFLLATPQHHCSIPQQSNLSREWIQASIPVQVAGQSERSSCSRYELDTVRNLSVFGIKPSLDLNHSDLGSGPGITLSSLKQEGCTDGWTYNTEYYQSTLVTEFSLVCSDQWKIPLTSLAFFIGGFAGCFLSGQISDRFGRKPVVFGAIALLSVFSSALAFAPSWLISTLLFFLLGLGQISSYVVAFVLGSEHLVGETRIFYTNLCLPYAYVFGTLLLCASAYLLQSWRYLALVMAAPGLACLPLWWLLPESPRWLVSQGRLQEAELLLRSAARENRVDAPPVIFVSARVEKPISQKSKSLGFLDLLKTTNIRNISVILWIMWFSFTVTYFGLAFNTSSLSGNPYISYSLLTAVEFPAHTASWLAARKLPRRLSFIGSNLLGALALFLIQVTLQSQPAVTLFLVLLGKFGVLMSNGILYIFSGELSPTGIRNTAMSSCATFSRAGSAVSPYLMQLAIFSQFLPWIILGSLSVLSGVLCIFLPETFRLPLPDTIEQVPQANLRWPCAFKYSPEGDKVKAKGQIIPPEIICTTHL